MQERGTGPPLTEPSRRTRYLGILGAVAAAVLAVDQLTKWWALEALADGDIDVVWMLRLRLTRNTGAAFSFGAGRGLVVVVVVIAVVFAMVWMGRGVTSRKGAVALGLVLGGAFGNLADRVFRADDGIFSGAVVDFIDLQWWPVFNVADVAISVGVIGLLVFTTVRDD